MKLLLYNFIYSNKYLLTEIRSDETQKSSKRLEMIQVFIRTRKGGKMIKFEVNTFEGIVKND